MCAKTLQAPAHADNINNVRTVMQGEHRMIKVEKKKPVVVLDCSIGVRLSSAEKAAVETWAEREDRKPAAIIRRLVRDGLRAEGFLP